MASKTFSSKKLPLVGLDDYWYKRLEGWGGCGYLYSPDMGPRIPTPGMTPSDGHHKTNIWQAGRMHATGMLSCSAFICHTWVDTNVALKL